MRDGDRARLAPSPRLQQTAPGHALPRRVRPFPDETAQSYLERLALANYLSSKDLRAYLAGGRRNRHAQVDTAALAVLAGMSEQALLRAVPELCSPAQLAAFPWLAGRVGPGVAVGAAACRRCAAGRTAKPVTRWRAHEDMVCLRHRRWTGSAGFGTGAQPDLRPHPEIVAASRRHRRLARQIGGPAVEHAFRAARIICTQWHNEWEWKLPGLDERLRSLGSRYRPGSGTPADEAALYPHVVALTRLLASPAWVGPVLDEHPDDTIPIPYLDLDRIDAEIARLRAGDPGYLDRAEQQRLREEIRLETRPGTRRFAGESWWWSATTRSHVAYKSWLERHHLIEADRDARVLAIAGQPFELTWPRGKRQVRHVPCFLFRLLDGGAVVTDCRTAAGVGDDFMYKTAVTAAACSVIGWDFRVVGEPDPVWSANLRWLAGYRHPRFGDEQLEAVLLELFADARPLAEAAAQAGDPIRVRPVLFHLLWRGRLTGDLSRPLGETTILAACADPLDEP